MKELQYIFDDKETYDQQILDGLKAYNVSQTGERHRERNLIYVFKDNSLVGGVNATMGWDWLHLNQLWYEDLDILYTILNHVYTAFHEEPVGVMKDHFHPDIVEALQNAGFTVDATIPNVPTGYDFYTLVNRTMTKHPTTDTYNVIIKSEVVEEYKDEYRAKYKLFMEKHKDTDTHPTYTIACLDKEKVVGGVVCSFSYDNVYVDLLWVNENYRGHDIGTTLMVKAEEEAQKHNIESIFLGTCSFQAPHFYSKLGYTKVGTTKNFPKGFVNYTFVKKLN